VTTTSAPPTVVLIHGLWMTPLSWEKWVERFAGRSHFLVGEPGWEEVADYALDWAVAHAATPAAV
jgi:hypothetical protein